MRLFHGDGVTDTLAAVLTHEAELDGAARRDAAAVASLLRRCLERDPKRRLRDIGEARLLLSGQIDASPVAPPEVQAAPLERTTPAAGRRTRRPRVRGGVRRGLDGRALRSGSRSGAALSVTPLTASGNVISATVSPDGRHIAYVESEQGRQSLWIQQVAGGQTLRLIPEQNVAYWSHAFTPDGNDIVYGLKSDDDPEGALYSISMLGGSPKRLVGNIDSAPTYSPDGRRMAYLRLRHPSLDQTSLMVAGADGGNPTTLMSVRLPEYVAGIFFGGPAWSPDGKTIVTSLGRRVARVGCPREVDPGVGRDRRGVDAGGSRLADGGPGRVDAGWQVAAGDRAGARPVGRAESGRSRIPMARPAA